RCAFRAVQPHNPKQTVLIEPATVLPWLGTTATTLRTHERAADPLSRLTPNRGDLAHTGPSRSRQRQFSSAEATGRHPRRFRSSWSPLTAARARLTAILPPEVAEAGRRKFGIANRVLDVLVPKPSLQRPRVVPGVG